ncbi:Protein cms1 [Malassezia brasiliensis]|uniref:Protein cms1 n=1 Tax=Malassezia brasiliensis TaxID=1821822 RepID=A0AAF0DSQ1_9BASI|nr:Protein cms1 [Malassezia brasiliensis]
MADSLDDGLQLDDDLVAFSGDEAGSDTQEFRKEAVRAEPVRDASESKKRKRKEARKKKAAAYRDEVHAGQAVALQPSERQADFFVAQQKKTYPKLSSLEMQEHQVPDAHATPDTFADANTPWRKEHGMPRVLVVTGNAQRAADLARALRALLPEDESRPAKRRKGAEVSTAGGVAKLFARHFKVDEQVTHLQENATPLAVGTPHRIQQLLERGALRTDHLQALVVDHSWTDAKMRTIFDTPETRDALVHLVSDPTLRKALLRKEASCKVILF